MVINPLQLDAPGIITALKGNGRAVVTASVQLLLLRDQIDQALADAEAKKYPDASNVILESSLKNLRGDLKQVAFGMYLGKSKLQERVSKAYRLAREME